MNMSLRFGPIFPSVPRHCGPERICQGEGILLFQRRRSISMQIDFTASAEVRQALANLGRTEDVKFSPSNKRLAIAGYAKNKILVVDVEISVSAAGKSVDLTDCVEMESLSFNGHYGLSFMDEETLVVANCSCKVTILKVTTSETV